MHNNTKDIAKPLRELARLLFLIIVSCSLILSPYVPIARANVFNELGGVVTDPLKLGHLSDRLQQTVMEALAQLNSLAQVANNLVKQRLDQIKEIIDFALKGGTAVEAQAYQEMVDLESKIMLDVKQLILEAKCAVTTTANGTLQEALTEALKKVAEAQPTIYFVQFYSIWSPKA
jgi:hypothetical protein